MLSVRPPLEGTFSPKDYCTVGRAECYRSGAEIWILLCLFRGSCVSPFWQCVGKMVEQRRSKANRNEWWLHEKNVLLIDLVKHRPMLYDLTSPRYSDNSAKNFAWKDIGEHLNTTAARCKARWEQLRSQYRKKIGINKPNGVKFRKWTYETRMSFLLPFMKERRSLMSLDASPDVSLDGGMPSDQYDYEIKLETIKEESRHREKGIFDDGFHENAEDCGEQDIGSSTRVTEAFREHLASRNKKHLSSAPNFLQQLLENTPCSSMRLPPDQRVCAIQDTASSTRISEAFHEQLAKRNKKHVPSTSSSLNELLENTSASSMKLPPDERNDTSYRPVYQTATDPIDQFFSLMATTVKKVNAADQHFLKSKIFNLVSRVEEKYLYQDQNALNIVYSPPSPSAYSVACNSQTSVVPPESFHSSRPLHTSFQDIQCVQLNE